MGNTAGHSLKAATLVWFFYAVTTVLLAILTSWALYSQVNYGYAFWYKQLDIQQHIDHYGPQNRFKQGFEQLPPEQHIEAFEQIRNAVHEHGEGLSNLQYSLPSGQKVLLLHRAEVVHLEDVANLIDAGRLLFVVLVLLWLPLAWCCLSLGLPGWRERLLITVIGVVGVLAWLAVAGPTEVFYQFHVWLFPADHQWFFYWQDSLMSTLMKAPALFGGIALAIALGALLLLPAFCFAGWGLASRLTPTRNRKPHLS